MLNTENIQNSRESIYYIDILYDIINCKSLFNYKQTYITNIQKILKSLADGKIKDKLYLERIVFILSNYDPRGWHAYIDNFNRGTLSGWVKKISDLKSVYISIHLNNNEVYGPFFAFAPRPDVKKAGLGTGLYGFSVKILPQEGLKDKFSVFTICDPITNHIIAFKFLCQFVKQD